MRIHIPKMKHKGRPEKKKKWDIEVRLQGGKFEHKKFRGTKSQAHGKAMAYLRLTRGNRRVVEVVLDDGK